VTAWAAEDDLDSGSIRSNTFTIEWPPRSGTTAEFPEVDRAGWFGLEEAREKLNPAQVPFVDRLAERLGPG
jgi:predicted NUDIX family NTP pyrophosphohydrolase